jgi:hypothetical protein
MAGHTPLDCLAKVLPQVEAVGDLHRVRRPAPGALRIRPGAVPADHLDPGMGPQPGRQRLRLPAGQQVKRRSGLAIDQQRAVDVAAAQGEVVHPEHPRRGRWRSGRAMTSRSMVDRLTVACSDPARRAPARPASATATCSRIERSSGVRRP